MFHTRMHDSSTEQTATTYSLSLMSMLRAGESNMCLRRPHVAYDFAICSLTSYSCIPSAANTEPRYLNLKTFSRGVSSQLTTRRYSCWDFIFLVRTGCGAVSARCPFKHWSLASLCALTMWILIPCREVHGKSQM